MCAQGESVCLTCAPSETRVASARTASQQYISRVPTAYAGLAPRETFRTLKTARRQAGIGGLRYVPERIGRMVAALQAAIARDTGLMRCTTGGARRSWGHSRLRRLHIAPLCHLFNVGGKLWIIRQHVVECVFVKCVEVTVVYRTDTGSAGLAEE